VPSEHDAIISIVTHVARAGDLARTVEALRANPAVREIISVTAVEAD